MFVICLHLTGELRSVRRLLGDREDVFITGDFYRVLEFVRNSDTTDDRLVAILGDYYPGRGEWIRGWTISCGIKDMRRDACCMIYASGRPGMAGVDGWINKLDRNLPTDWIRQLVNAGVDDPELLPDFDALFARFPWIQRPR